MDLCKLPHRRELRRSRGGGFAVWSDVVALAGWWRKRVGPPGENDTFHHEILKCPYADAVSGQRQVLSRRICDGGLQLRDGFLEICDENAIEPAGCATRAAPASRRMWTRTAAKNAPTPGSTLRSFLQLCWRLFSSSRSSSTFASGPPSSPWNLRLWGSTRR